MNETPKNYTQYPKFEFKRWAAFYKTKYYDIILFYFYFIFFFQNVT